MTESWFYAREGQQQGPVDFPTLRQKAAMGEIQANDLVWREGTSDWVAASTVADLFPAPVTPTNYYQPTNAGLETSRAPVPVQPLSYDSFPPAGAGDFSGQALTSMILGIAGFLLCWGSAISGGLAMYFGIKSMNGMTASGNPKGRGYAIAGIVLGVIQLLWGIIFIIATIFGSK